MLKQALQFGARVELQGTFLPDVEGRSIHPLGGLRLGDVVALRDYDSSWNHRFLRDAVGIGVIAQGDSPRAGYGPGITLIMTSAGGNIEPMVTPGANLKDLLMN